jgi:hypothetical protein
MSAPTNITEAVAAVKRKSALIEQYLGDTLIIEIIGDYTTSTDGTTSYDVDGAAVACLQYARGLIPTMKTIGSISLAFESIDKSIAALDPGGTVRLTRPYGDTTDGEIIDYPNQSPY